MFLATEVTLAGVFWLMVMTPLVFHVLFWVCYLVRKLYGLPTCDEN